MGLADKLAALPPVPAPEPEPEAPNFHAMKLLLNLTEHTCLDNVWDAVGQVVFALDIDDDVRLVAKALGCATISDLMRRWRDATPAAREKALQAAYLTARGAS